MSCKYSSCFAVHLAEHLLDQHFRKADDGIQRRAQLMRHVGQELKILPHARHVDPCDHVVFKAGPRRRTLRWQQVEDAREIT